MPQTPTILALDLLVTGPELRSDENRLAFARIVDAIEQFSAHSRERVVLVRQPTDFEGDHFAILWSRGLAIASFSNQAGNIRGQAIGPWHIETTNETFANPFEQLAGPARQLSQMVGATSSVPISVVAIFTGTVGELDVQAESAPAPSFAMTLNYATSRSMVHMPNILRAIDQKSAVASTNEIEQFTLKLDRSGAATEILAKESQGSSSPMIAAPLTPKRTRWWFITGIVLTAIVIYVMAVSLRPSKTALPDTAQDSATVPPKSRPGQIVIELPKEVQLFVSPTLYESRLELDHALTHAEGQRYLPATEQIISFDSLTLAKGVYGYFKADNAWRKGKLLQTFQRTDTIHIDNFLGPLP